MSRNDLTEKEIKILALVDLNSRYENLMSESDDHDFDDLAKGLSLLNEFIKTLDPQGQKAIKLIVTNALANLLHLTERPEANYEIASQAVKTFNTAYQKLK